MSWLGRVAMDLQKIVDNNRLHLYHNIHECDTPPYSGIITTTLHNGMSTYTNSSHVSNDVHLARRPRNLQATNELEGEREGEGGRGREDIHVLPNTHFQSTLAFIHFISSSQNKPIATPAPKLD